MRRRLQNQLQGDPAQNAIQAREKQLLGDVARFPRLQPEIVNRAHLERITTQVREAEFARNGGTGATQGTRPGLSSRPGALPPSPAAPRPKLKLKGNDAKR